MKWSIVFINWRFFFLLQDRYFWKIYLKKYPIIINIFIIAIFLSLQLYILSTEIWRYITWHFKKSSVIIIPLFRVIYLAFPARRLRVLPHWLAIDVVEAWTGLFDSAFNINPFRGSANGPVVLPLSRLWI